MVEELEEEEEELVVVGGIYLVGRGGKSSNSTKCLGVRVPG